MPDRAKSYGKASVRGRLSVHGGKYKKHRKIGPKYASFKWYDLFISHRPSNVHMYRKQNLYCKINIKNLLTYYSAPSGIRPQVGLEPAPGYAQHEQPLSPFQGSGALQRFRRGMGARLTYQSDGSKIVSTR